MGNIALPAGPGRPRRTRGVRTALVLVAAAVAAAALVLVLTGAVATRAASTRGTQAVARVDARVTLAGGASMPVPRSFLGVSAEYWTIPNWGRRAGLLRRVFTMLSGDGMIRLRIGGDSADRAVWSPTKELPEWVFELTPAWLRQAKRIVRATGTRLILDLNTMSSTPQLAARWARTAIAGLQPGSIRAFEVGNEPDIYNQSAWQHLTTGPGAPPAPGRITPAGYARSFGAYADAVTRVAHGIALLAPALAEPQKNSSWIVRLLGAPHPRLSGITAHRYPYSACAKPSAATFPSIPRILSENATAGMGVTAHMLERITDRSRLPIWLTEINSVTCGGLSGISDTFATALWAPDALFELVRSGVEAAFVHVRPPLSNMAFSLSGRGLTARPLLYGMVLFARMLGPGARLVQLNLRASGTLNLKAWAVRVNGGGLRVLLLDKGARPVHVRVRLRHVRAVTVQRLTAPGIAAASGERLAGQRLTSAATWAGKRVTGRLTASGNGVVVTLPRFSAALLTVVG